MSEMILQINHLSKSFGSHEVLRDIDFTVEKGDVTSIIGASGSGKSTLLRCLNLLEEPDGGHIWFGGQLPHDLQHLAYHLRVQGGGGLVEQQHLRVHGQGPGDGHPLLLAAGDLPWLGVDVGGHAHLFQIAQGAPAGVLLVLLQHLHLAHHAVFQHGHVIEQVKGLKHHTHMGAVGGGVDAPARHVLPVVQDLPGGGGLQQVDAPQQGGLAGAGGADDAGDVSPGYREVDVPQHFVAAERFGQVVDLQNHIAHIIDLPLRFRSGFSEPA